MKIDAKFVEYISCHVNYLWHVYFSVGTFLPFSNIPVAVCYMWVKVILESSSTLFDFIDFFPINETYIRCQQKGLLL